MPLKKRNLKVAATKKKKEFFIVIAPSLLPLPKGERKYFKQNPFCVGEGLVPSLSGGDEPRPYLQSADLRVPSQGVIGGLNFAR
jgi:hypothetical protein